MRHVALIYNPFAGQRPDRHQAIIGQVAGVLRRAGVEVEVIPTESPRSAGKQAAEAIRQGCDTVLACGGDGTVHESLQRLVGGPAALGVVPLGTANALATDLGLPSSPIRAVKRLLDAVPERVSVGRVHYVNREGQPRSRYFVVAAGIGADALFMSRLDPQLKQRFGYALYVIEAFRLWMTHTFPVFTATFEETGKPALRTEQVTQILAVRIADFGGVLRNLVPGAGRQNGNLHVIAAKTASRLRYLQFMVSVLMRQHSYSDAIELVDCASVECAPHNGTRETLFVEADGELLGTLPVRIEVVPEALTLLIPKSAASRITR